MVKFEEATTGGSSITHTSYDRTMGARLHHSVKAKIKIEFTFQKFTELENKRKCFKQTLKFRVILTYNTLAKYDKDSLLFRTLFLD